MQRTKGKNSAVSFYQVSKNIVTSSWQATLKSYPSSCLMSSIPFIHPFQSPHYQLWAAAAGLCDGGGAGGLWVIVLAAGLFWHCIRQWNLCSEQSLTDESVPKALCVWRPVNADMNQLLKETLVINYRNKNTPPTSWWKVNRTELIYIFNVHLEKGMFITSTGCKLMIIDRTKQ